MIGKRVCASASAIAVSEAGEKCQGRCSTGRHGGREKRRWDPGAMCLCQTAVLGMVEGEIE